MLGLFIVISCSTSDDKSNQIDDNINEPFPPNRGYNMNLGLRLLFLDSNGLNILDPENQIINERDLDIDIYGINGYEDEYPYPSNYDKAIFIQFGYYTFPDKVSTAYQALFNDYLYKHNDPNSNNDNSVLQHWFNINKFLKYKITFPDNTIYEVKVEGALKPNSTVDYYPTKVYINDELKWQQPQGTYNGSINYLTIVK